MNLLIDKWIPVRTMAGQSTKIAPYEIVGDGIAFVDFARPDFNLSALIMLIGLTQIVRNKISKPISGKEFKEALQPYVEYFNLTGKGPLFMQDPYAKGDSPIFALLLDGAREKEIKERRDFFRKEGMMKALCPSCAAMALYTQQLFAYTGGGGYFTSPLFNSLLMIKEGECLWETVWLNTQEPEVFRNYGNGKDDIESIFPWLISTPDIRNYENKTKFPAEHLFWLMPWRLQLVSEQREEVCDCCGDLTMTPFTRYLKSGQGIRYQPKNNKEVPAERTSPVEHPLAVYNIGALTRKKKSKKATTKAAVKGKVNITAAKLGHSMSSEIIYNSEAFQIPTLGDHGIVTLCGTSMNQAKYVSWYEKSIPYWKDKAQLIKGMLEIEGDLLDTVYGYTHKVTAMSDIRDEMERVFYDLVVKDSPLDEWVTCVFNSSLRAFDAYAAKPYLRKLLIEAMGKVIGKKGYSVPKAVHAPLKRYSRIGSSKLPTAAESVIMKWWSWMNNYSKQTRYDIRRLSSIEEVKENSDFLDLFKKISVILFPDDTEAPDESFEDRLALCVYLMVQLKEHNKESFQSVSDPLSCVGDLVKAVREKEGLNIISMFNSILMGR